MKNKSAGKNFRDGLVLALLAWLSIFGCVNAVSGAEPFQLITVTSPGSMPPAGGSGDSWNPVISRDGRYILFASTANNLVLNTNNQPFLPPFPASQNVFLKDRTNGTMTLVSVDQAGTGGADGDSVPMDISTNGQYVLFESSADNLTEGLPSFGNNIFVRDLVNGTTTLVSVNTNGIGGNGTSQNSTMTPDGRYVAFTSLASDLVLGDTNNIGDVFVRDLESGTTTLASPGAIGTFNVSLGSDLAAITPDGRYVAFYSTATGLVPGIKTSGEIYIRDRVAGTTTFASAFAHTVVQAQFNTTNVNSFNQTISADGQYVAYEAGTNANAGGSVVILRYSQTTGLTDVIDTNATGGQLGYEANNHSLDMTPDGRFVSFVANAGAGGLSAIKVWEAQSNMSTLASGNLASNAVSAGAVCDWPVLDVTGRYVAFLSVATDLTSNAVVDGTHLYVRDLQAGTTQLIDADSNGVGSTSNLVTFPRMSTNGLLVAFEAPDGSLVAADNNQSFDVFLRDLTKTTNELISARQPALFNLTPDGICTLSLSSVSGTARFVAFASVADNLVANDTNELQDVFVRDLESGTNILVSVDTNGVFPGNGFSTDSAISGDGRYVAFTSTANNLVAGDTNNFQDVFVRDLQLGTTALVSVNANNGGPGNGDSYSPTISTDGRYVLFHSKAQNLAGGIANTLSENLYWRDLQSGVTRVLTTNQTSGTPVVGAMSAIGRFVVAAAPAKPIYVWDMNLNTIIFTNTTVSAKAVGISPDGTKLGFLTTGFQGQVYAMDFLANSNTMLGAPRSLNGAGLRFGDESRFLVYSALDSNSVNQVFLYDFSGGTNTLVSRSYLTLEGGNGDSDSADISSDGRFVAYRSAASDLVPGVSNPLPNIYLFDRTSGATTLATTSLYGNYPGNQRSLTPVFSADAKTLVFESWADDLAAQDFNQWSDLFALNLYSSNAQPPFHAGIVLSGPGNSGPTISWTVTPGMTYQVQFKDNLSDPAWQMLNGNLTVVGSLGYVNDLPPVSGRRFYRVVGY